MNDSHVSNDTTDPTLDGSWEYDGGKRDGKSKSNGGGGDGGVSPSSVGFSISVPKTTSICLISSLCPFIVTLIYK